MSRRRPRSTLQPLSEIQLTSMMDLSFLLLITFIISFPLIEQGIAVNLPRGRSSDMKADKSHSITLDERHRIYFDEAQMSMDQLATELNRLAKKDPDAVVRVRADERLGYGDVVKVLRILHDAKIARMALVTQEDGKPAP